MWGKIWKTNLRTVTSRTVLLFILRVGAHEQKASILCTKCSIRPILKMYVGNLGNFVKFSRKILEELTKIVRQFQIIFEKNCGGIQRKFWKYLGRS